MEEPIYTQHYQGFEIAIFSVPSQLWGIDYYHTITDLDGRERLDGSEYEPSDFVHQNDQDAIAGAKFQIDRYWKFGGNWYPSDDEVQHQYYREAVEQGYRQ